MTCSTVHRLLAHVVRDTVVFFFSWESGMDAFVIYCLVIKEHVSWSIHRDPKHSQLIGQWCYQLQRIFHSYELWSKLRVLHAILPFTMPNNGSTIDKHQNSRHWPPGELVSCITGAHKTMCGHRLPPWLRHVQRNLFLRITIEVLSVKLPEVILRNPWLLRIKEHPSFRYLL